MPQELPDALRMGEHHLLAGELQPEHDVLDRREREDVRELEQDRRSTREREPVSTRQLGHRIAVEMDLGAEMDFRQRLPFRDETRPFGEERLARLPEPLARVRVASRM